MKLKLGVLTAACAAMSCACRPAAQQIRDYLNGLNSQGSITASVLVSQRGQVLVSQGFGLADEDSHAPNTPQTKFRIGSNTKQFTAMAILLLQDRGLLSVQDPLCHYIASCPAAWAPVTLQNLLSHTSGITNYTNFDNFPSLIGTAATPDQLIARFRTQPLDFTPGSRWGYSNSGYVLLGAIVEQVSGQTYADFIDQNILQPLSLNSSGYDSNTPPSPDHATGYLSDGVKPVFIDLSEFYAAGALYSTVEDLNAWDQALLGQRLGSPAALQSMWAPQIACPAGGCAMASDTGYGDGWFLADVSGHPYIYHWGRVDGYDSANGFYPRDQVTVVVLSNLETTDVWSISAQLGQIAISSP